MSVAGRVSCGVEWLRCGVVAVWRSCGVGEFKTYPHCLNLPLLLKTYPYILKQVRTNNEAAFQCNFLFKFFIYFLDGICFHRVVTLTSN